ncbi:ATPase AAA [Luteolibacter sp. LG18]|nr:ATPase AAA [Luteolibacter sp. LG18]
MPAPGMPAWAQELISLYESGAASQFILHGNIGDRLVATVAGTPKLVPLEGFLKDTLLQRFDVILSYDLGNGMRVEKGGETFAKWPSYGERELPSAPREAVHVITHYLRFCANLAAMKPERAIRVAVIVRAADLVVPASAGSANVETSAMALQIREWSTDPMITGHHCASFLITENFSDLHRLVAQNARAARLTVPLPDAAGIEAALAILEPACAKALAPFSGRLGEPAAALVGSTVHAVSALLQRRQHAAAPITDADLIELKKQLVEEDAQGLIEFIQPVRTLEDLHGQEGVKKWLRQDIVLWRKNDLQALPMGYLFCGPVGTGKTFLVECLAGEAGAPVVKIKNFRDRWVGSTESNLEKIFRLLEALGRCIVFVDEADQALGRRSAESGDSGISGRVYGMMAEQMSQSRNRGRLLWALATSRPDLVEVDLKRPGRVDVKIPLFPTGTSEEGYGLIRALSKRRGLILPDTLPDDLRAKIPDLLTPGAAEALAVKAYRVTKTTDLTESAALAEALKDYQPPVSPVILEQQIGLAVAEATDLSFVPERFRR